MKIYFSYKNCKVYDVECGARCTVREFLDNAEKKLNKLNEDEDNYVQVSLKNIHCVYLRCKKIEETENLQDYSDDLKSNILFISDSTEKPIESSFNLINLDDYENLEFIRYKNAYCIAATDKKTKKKVFIKAYDSDPNRLQDIYVRIQGYSVSSRLKHCVFVKFLGFRYPLNEEEKKQTQIHEIQNEKTKKSIDLTGFIFVFEFVKYGSISELNKNYLISKGKENEIINPTIRCKIMYGIASIMKYIHNEGEKYQHLDIDDILIDEKLEPKLSGFILAKIDYKLLREYFTPCTAPEMFNDEDEPYSFKADVYSYGMILYRLFSAKLDFGDGKQIRSQQQFFMRIYRGQRPQRPENIPDSYWELIQKCWKQNPSDRPTFDVIVEELMSDKYVIEEFGMKTNIDELHEYQRRIDSSEFMKILEYNAKLQRQQIEFEAKLQNQQIEFQKRMSQMKLMFEQTKLMYEQIELNKKQPLTTSDTENNENKKE